MRGLNPRIHDLNLDLLSFKKTIINQHKHHRHSTPTPPSFDTTPPSFNTNTTVIQHAPFRHSRAGGNPGLRHKVFKPRTKAPTSHQSGGVTEGQDKGGAKRRKPRKLRFRPALEGLIIM